MVGGRLKGLGTALALLGLITLIAGFLLPGDLVVIAAPLVGPTYEARFEQLRVAWLLMAIALILVGLWYSSKKRR